CARSYYYGSFYFDYW
nr:immunoglobulin heavy chain junction region [Mus musculus]NSM04242.1 immunoglobulin heavy chain junction region [Mus musculus]NSM04886.1 immunoglobulin heavy chain junction region [Mus musculus]NSM04914.1 immunoglobulin heavy chain junction region [Mus musculus]NSM05807.1 immunoglobulin heavy chain junction region [Mus musculus]